MFHSIPDVVQKRMRFLEERDAQDRQDGTAFAQRLKQVPRETGRFLALVARSGLRSVPVQDIQPSGWGLQPAKQGPG